MIKHIINTNIEVNSFFIQINVTFNFYSLKERLNSQDPLLGSIQLVAIKLEDGSPLPLSRLSMFKLLEIKQSCWNYLLRTSEIKDQNILPISWYSFKMKSNPSMNTEPGRVYQFKSINNPEPELI